MVVRHIRCAFSAVFLSLLWATASADKECGKNGLQAYVGPGGRGICSCEKGWTGTNCDQLMSPLFKSCKNPGQQGNCADGLQCAEWSDGTNRCTCNSDSRIPACSDDALSGCAGGCPEGLRCRNGPLNEFCACAPFSKEPACQCDGTWDGGSYPEYCTRGNDGFCMAVSSGDTCYEYPQIVFGIGPSACPPGKALNSMGICVCLPLSTNPDCKPRKATTTTSVKVPTSTKSISPRPTSTSSQTGSSPEPPAVSLVPGSPIRTAGIVCAKIAPGCKAQYRMMYWVFQPGTRVASGKVKVDPTKNSILVSKQIVAGQKYEVCVRPSTTNTISFDKKGCTRVPTPNTCCKNVRAFGASSQSLRGCTDMMNNFKVTNC